MNALAPLTFSQSSLQDLVDCPHRFYLRSLRRLAWPAIQAEPAREFERHLLRGQRFHRLAQQALLGIPLPLLTQFAEADPDEHLAIWWHNFREHVLDDLLEDCDPGKGATRYVEAALEAPLGASGHRLMAIVDLLLVNPAGQFTIYDWKTSLYRPKGSDLRQRMQSRVYPSLVCRAAHTIHPASVPDPANVRMIYWFAEPDLAPEVIIYSAAQQKADESALLALAHKADNLREQLRSRPAGMDELQFAAQCFERSQEERNCRYCVYRSLCERGEAAPAMDADAPEWQPEESFEQSLEQIAESLF